MDRGRVAGHLRRYRAHLERHAAERHLQELEDRLAEERQRRGMQPIISDTGQILGWVDTRPQMPGGR